MRLMLTLLALVALLGCSPQGDEQPARAAADPAETSHVPESGTVVPNPGTNVPTLGTVPHDLGTPALVAVAVVARTTIVLATPPTSRANQYRSDMTRSAYRVFGPDAPVALLAAQIQQESGWRPDALSPVGAIGIAQFMPATAEDMARKHPRDCAPANPLSASWGFTCRDRYMQSRIENTKPMAEGLTECDSWVFALRAYNGGLGWVNRDRRKALAAGVNADNWQAVQPFNAGRNAGAFRENTEYGPKILKAQPRYEQAGWGRGVCA